jgi:hypothetical protein
VKSLKINRLQGIITFVHVMILMGGDCFHLVYKDQDMIYGVIRNAVYSINFNNKYIFAKCYDSKYDSKEKSNYQYYIVTICNNCTGDADTFVSSPMSKEVFDKKIKEMGIEK